MKKRVISLFLALIILFSNCTTAFAYDKDKHDDLLTEMLFGSSSLKANYTEGSKQYKKMIALEAAVAICLDQYNGSYSEELEYLLNDMHIHGLPDSVDVIDFGGNQYHRKPTHRGWNFDYTNGGASEDKAKWPIRKEILLQTVNEVFDFSDKAGKWSILGIEKYYKYDKQCEAFAELLYYIHVLSDYKESKTKYLDSNDEDGSARAYRVVVNQMIPIKKEHPSKDDPDIISELERILPLVFKENTSTHTYKGMMSELKKIDNKASRWVKKNPDIKNNYEEYEKYAEKLWDMMEQRIPKILKREPFFSDVFYPAKTSGWPSWWPFSVAAIPSKEKIFQQMICT